MRKNFTAPIRLPRMFNWTVTTFPNAITVAHVQTCIMIAIITASYGKRWIEIMYEPQRCNTAEEDPLVKVGFLGVWAHVGVTWKTTRVTRSHTKLWKGMLRVTA